MAKRTKQLDWDAIRRYAVDGARARLHDLRQEMSKILTAFPQLGLEAGVPALRPQERVSPAARPGSRRARRRVSPAQRKAVSERMKKYWAARREGAQADAKPGGRSAKQGRRRAGRTRAAKRAPRKAPAAGQKPRAEVQKDRTGKPEGPTA